MPEEKKLGDSVTYTNPDKGNKLMTVGGVLLKEGESVNLVEKLGEARARPIIEKLAKNRYFKVEGGEDHSQKQPPQAPGAGEEDVAALAVAEEARIRREQGDAKADEYVQSLDESGRKRDQGGGGEDSAQRRPKQGEPPPDVVTPDQMTLETPSKRRG